MYHIPAGEPRFSAEERIGRVFDLELKQEEVIPGGVRCYYGFDNDKQGFFEVIYIDDIVLDCKIHEDIVKVLADDDLQEMLDEIAEDKRDRNEVEIFLEDRLFYKPIGSSIQTKKGKLQRYGEKIDEKSHTIDFYVIYNEKDQVIEAKVIDGDIDAIDD